MRTLAILATVFYVALFQPVFAQERGFFNDNERGWYWLEDPEIEETKEEVTQPPEQPSQPSQPKEMVALDYEWLKENFDSIMSQAINNPTDENVANFAYAQRLMLDMSSRFQSKMTDFMMSETQLDESKRRPNTAFALNSFKSEVSQRIKKTVEEINSKTMGVWFFYSSTCQYCMKMLPVIKRFEQDYEVKVLAVSLDGGILPGMEDMDIVVDENREVAKRFDVTMTPTTMMVMNDNSAHLIAAGLRSLQELEQRYIRAAKIKGIIDDETYQRTKSVYEQNLYNNENGVLMVSKEKLESDPNFLAEALRSRLSDVTAYGTKLIDTSSQ